MPKNVRVFPKSEKHQETLDSHVFFNDSMEIGGHGESYLLFSCVNCQASILTYENLKLYGFNYQNIEFKDKIVLPKVFMSCKRIQMIKAVS